jgi:hypothetical protein
MVGSTMCPLAVKATEREPLEEAAAGEQDDEERGDQEARDRVADEHDRTAGEVEAAAVADRLGDAERDGDQVDQQGGPEAERDRDGKPLQDELQHGLAAEEAVAEVEAEVAADHVEEAGERRLVEAEHFADVVDHVGIEAAGASVGGGAAAHLGGAAAEAGGHAAAAP